jgi:hypothetical protein
MQAITSQHLGMQAITSQQQHLGCCNYMLHVLQQARNAAKQRIIEGLVCNTTPMCCCCCNELGLRCAVFAALLIFYLLGGCATNRLMALSHSKSKGAHHGTYATD